LKNKLLFNLGGVTS